MKWFRKISNGIVIIFLGLMHTNYALTSFSVKFHDFFNSYFFKISKGTDELPAAPGKTNYETFAAFWFFYYGLAIILIGILVHNFERKMRIIPHSFTISYIVFLAVGSYMVPSSGMTFFMLPHAIYMLLRNYYNEYRLKRGK